MQALTIGSSLKGWSMDKMPDPKSMAKQLRSELSNRKIDITHSAALEIVARQFGLNDWNTLSAQMGSKTSKDGVQCEAPCPILRIFDEEKAKEYYVGFLGFKIDWEHRFEENFPLYCQISRGNLILHLSGHHGDASPGSSVFVRMSGLKELHQELLAKDYKHAKPGIVEQSWGYEMKIADPFSNTIRFSENKK